MFWIGLIITLVVLALIMFGPLMWCAVIVRQIGRILDRLFSKNQQQHFYNDIIE